MGIAAFQKGAVVVIDGCSHTLLRKISDAAWQIEESKTKRITEASDDELRELYSGGHLVFPIDHPTERVTPLARQSNDHIDDALFEVAKVRRRYVIAVLDVASAPERIAPIVIDIWRKLQKPPSPPHPVSVLRWKRKYVAAGRDIRALMDNARSRGNRSERYPAEVLRIASETIDALYMTLERKTIQDVVDHAIVRVERENSLRPSASQLPRPTRRLISRLIGRIPAFDKHCARYGRTAAMNRFRSVQGHRITYRPLERCEIDHTPLDIIAVDDATFLPLGRPFLTACIDDYTRCILGIFLSFEPPSYLSVANCLRHAFLPKTSLRSEYPDIINTWDAYGVMRELVVDNGGEFHSNSFEQMCYTLGIEIHYAPRKTGWFKGKIERFLGTTNREIAHGSPGTTFANILDRGDYDSSKHAVVRLSTLQKIVRLWIVDHYHQRKHRALGIAPAAAWTSNVRPEDIQVPDNPARLDALLGRTQTRRLSHKGIELDGLFYNSPDLADLRQRLGDNLSVEIRINDANIGSIVVFSPDKRQMFEVRCLKFQYADGLSRWQHKVCKRFATRHLDRRDSIGWLTAKARIAELIEAEFAHKRRRTGKRLARYQGGQALSGNQIPNEGSPLSTIATPRNAPPKAAHTETDRAPLAPITDFTPPTRRLSPVIRNRSNDGEPND